MLDSRKITNFEIHLERLQKNVYHEDESQQHNILTEMAVQRFIIPNKQTIENILDVGCGSGLALEYFQELNINAIGITLNDDDLTQCKNKGFKVQLQDMSFLDFDDSAFDLIWVRHCLEHSPMPLITLFEFERVTKPSGFLYVEVPQDDSIHIDNPNHYSVLSDRAWQSLFRRTDFELLDRVQFTVQLKGWVDIYWFYWLKKKS
jgi:ubiquinone/menaquinone biosynthesis C-methylase UbiE